MAEATDISPDTSAGSSCQHSEENNDEVQDHQPSTPEEPKKPLNVCKI